MYCQGTMVRDKNDNNSPVQSTLTLTQTKTKQSKNAIMVTHYYLKTHTVRKCSFMSLPYSIKLKLRSKRKNKRGTDLLFKTMHKLHTHGLMCCLCLSLVLTPVVFTDIGSLFFANGCDQILWYVNFCIGASQITHLGQQRLKLSFKVCLGLDLCVRPVQGGD